MLTKSDEEWLNRSHPNLLFNGSSISGTINFAATYNAEINRFLILEDGVVDEVGGIPLSGTFKIRIEPRLTFSHSALPAVYVDDVEPIENRHFGFDKSACLCSPF